MPLSQLRKPEPQRAAVWEHQLGTAPSINDFAPELWRDIFTRLGAADVSKQRVLTQVTYEDRYLSSPLAARALHALLDALRPYGLVRATAVHVKTLATSHSRETDVLHANFAGGGAQKEVIRGLLTALVDNPKVDALGHTRDLAHARTLNLSWDDGTKLRIGLDQGLGFIETHRRESFLLSEKPADQVRRLLSMNTTLRSHGKAWVWAQRA
jgi:hypothetical protein